jgi:acyl-coenzyme A synthetase/AMP-(fatty) acid ligase
MAKLLHDLTLSDIEDTRVSNPKAIYKHLQRIVKTQEGAANLWTRISQELLAPSHPFALHRLLYRSAVSNWNDGPPPAWTPTLTDAKQTNVGRILEARGPELLVTYKDPIASFQDFYELSVTNPEVYWKIVFDELSLKFHKRPSCILASDETEFRGEPCPGGRWLPGARLNAAECCLQIDSKARAQEPAILWRDEGQEDDSPVQSLTMEELRKRVCQVANALEGAGFRKGDAIAINMPMNVHADVILRGQRTHPLFNRVVEAKAPRAIVLPACDQVIQVTLREGDLSWDAFLELASEVDRPDDFEAVALDIEDTSNILFSSGTTGDPKAIPWTHGTPIKAAADAWAHHDIRHKDVVAWPTNLGWMMGPWLIYAALLNRASIALYNGAPLGHGFAKFIQDARVTMLGLVPSIVKAWRSSNAVNGCDWSHLRCFSSSGEASNVDDYLWLMSQAKYKPIIEYCGGTEIGGGFVTGSMLQPQALSAFSTPAMGCKIIILDDHGLPLPSDKPGTGECALDPSIFGASMLLLNANHFNVYYKGMPQFQGKTLRRHGDEIERTVGGYYRAHGRVDDTMNLGGIKVSSVEIERVCNAAHEDVLETAAVGVPPSGGGPEQLLIVVVLKEGATGISPEELKKVFNKAIQAKLNPLFKVNAVATATSLPRTASNKVMRRMLRSQYGPEVTSPRKSSL